MDALKKAEREKKEAAKRQEQAEGLETETPAAESSAGPAESEVKIDSRPPRTTLDDTDTWGQEIVAGDNTSEIPSFDTTGEFSNTSELALEPITHADDTAEIPSVASSAVSSADPEDPTLNVTMNELSLADLSSEAAAVEQEDEGDEAAPATIDELQSDHADLLDETFHGVALDTNDVNPELFQETMQGEPFLPDDASDTWGETLPGIPAAQLAKDIGSEDQPTPVAAQTVFAAGGTRKSGGNFKWALLGLAILAIVSGFVWYYLTITPMNRSLPSPQIAQGIEQVGPPLHETLQLDINRTPAPSVPQVSGTADAAVPGTDTMTGSEAIAAAPTTTTESEVVIDSAASTGEAADPLEAATAAAMEQEMPADAEVEPGVAVAEAEAGEMAGEEETTETAEAAEEEKPSMLAAVTGMLSKPGALPEKIDPEPSLIQISRSKAPDDMGKTLGDAYIAYQKGAYGTAVEKYQQTLEKYPDNRDALLGLGAIAVNGGDYQAAYRYYARVLQVNPSDRYARAALINLQDRRNLAGRESEITTMLHGNPDSHYLHFTLGNIYAAGNRWAEAQQAFFDAYRLNSSSPDYALNLAISLDHIGQYAAAVDYYNAALDLSRESTAAFNAQAVNERISKLEQATETGN